MALNSRALNDKPGYAGHVVVVFGADKNNFWLHDPGLPPMPSRKVSRQKLLEAWQWAGGQNTNLAALKASKNRT